MEDIELKEKQDNQDYIKLADPETVDEIKTSSKKKLILIILGIMLVIIILIIVLVLCLKDDDDECEIDNGYILINGNCEKYSFEAIYNSEIENKSIKLMNILPSDIITMIVDNKRVIPSKEYIFNSIGPHKVNILMDISNSSSLSKMFYQIKNLTSLSFTKHFKTNKITSVKGMFSSCSSLTSINFTSWNTENIQDFSSLFTFCSSLKSIDLSNFNTKSVKYINNVFYKCKNLSAINLTNFE